MGPRVHDMEVKDIVDIVLKVNAGAFSFEAANPRHEHEWTVWGAAKIPDGAVLIPGVISHSTVLVEHPELIAQRIARYAAIVGRENVIAGSDCGFATFAGSDEVHESIVWAKFSALAEGARIATKQLWAKRSAAPAKPKAESREDAPPRPRRCQGQDQGQDQGACRQGEAALSGRRDATSDLFILASALLLVAWSGRRRRRNRAPMRPARRST